jgi:hypothetical protein
MSRKPAKGFDSIVAQAAKQERSRRAYLTSNYRDVLMEAWKHAVHFGAVNLVPRLRAAGEDAGTSIPQAVELIGELAGWCRSQSPAEDPTSMLGRIVRRLSGLLARRSPLTPNVMGHNEAPLTGSQAGPRSAEGSDAQLGNGPAATPAAKREVVIQFIGGDRGGNSHSVIQLPREYNATRDAIASASRRSSFRVDDPIFAASLDRVIATFRAEPTVFHFAGHGEDRKLVLVQDRDLLVEKMHLDLDQAEKLFRSFPSRVQLVVFNTCRSLDLARHLTATSAVDLAIGVEGAIGDNQAIGFARTFYRQLAEGLHVQRAFDLAGVQLGQENASSRPQLLHAAGIEPTCVIFAPDQE